MIPVAALLLASTLYAGPEVPVAAEVADAQPYVQVLDDAAASPDKALVVWHDDRLLRGVRVDRDGTTLDPVPLLIAYTVWQRSVSVARGATNWLVVSGGATGIEATIVGDDGAVGPRTVITNQDGVPPVVAFDGSGYLVVWSNWPTSRLFATRIDASGAVVENGIPISPDEYMLVSGLQAAPGGGFVLVTSGSAIQVLRLNAQGREMSRTSLPWPAGAYNDSYTLDASGRVVHGWTGQDGRAHVQREGAEAVALDAERVDDFVTVGGTTYAAAAGDGKASLWTLDGTLVRELLSVDGMVRMVAMGNRVLAAGGDQDVLLTLLDASMQTIVPEHLAYAEPALRVEPAVAQAGDVRLIAWTETDVTKSRVVARIGDGAPFLIGEGTEARIATDGRDFLVAWHRGAFLAFRRVLRDGSMGPRQSLDFTNGAGCVTWNGSDYIVGYVDVLFGRNVRSAVAQRVTREGELSGEPEHFSPSQPLDVACASTEATTLFAWFDEAGKVTGTTLTRGGTKTFSGFPIATGGATSVAAHGDGFVVAWGSGWATVSEEGTVGLPHTLESTTARVFARPGGSLLTYGRNPLRMRALDANGDFAGEELLIPGAEQPAFAGGLLAYRRDVDFVLPHARWRVFTRELTVTPARRRTLRH